MTVMELIAKLTLDTGDFKSNLLQVKTGMSEVMSNAAVMGSQLQKTGKTIEGVGKKLLPLSVAAGTVFTASTVSASKFTDGMAKMSTLFDTNKYSVDELSKEFLKLSSSTGKSATELAEAGYQALSAGISVDNSVKFIETASKLAKVGFTSSATAVDVLTTAINAYGLSENDAYAISNKLVLTQNLGKTTVDELAASMGKIIPTASSMNVSIDQLTAGYVEMTKQGINTNYATTYMNAMLNELGKSSTTVGALLKEKTGKSFQELMKDGYSLGDVLGILQDEANASGINFNELWSSSEAGKGAISLLNQGIDEFNGTVDQMQNGTDVLAEGLDKLSTPSEKAKKALNQLKNSGIEMGQQLLIAIGPAISALANGIEKLTTWFSGLSDRTKLVIVSILGIVAAIGPTLIMVGKVIAFVGQLMMWLPAISGALGAISLPMLGIAAAIAAVIAVGVLLYKNWDKIKAYGEKLVKSLISKFNSLKSSVVNAFKSIGSAIAKPFTTAYNSIKSAIDKIKTLINNLKSKLSSLKSLKWLKVPKVSVSGGKVPFGIGGKGSAPSFSIAWHKKAMDNPYLFSDATLFGAGEAGDEMLYGKNNLMQDIKNAVENANNSGTYYFEIPVNIDGKKVAKATAKYTESELAQRKIRSNRTLGII